MSKQLTLELIMFKTKTNQLDKIKNLNLCANDLSDISIVNQMPSLEVLSLSVNAINSLEDIADCPNLQELYIRRNNVESLNELRYLQDLPKLRTLWLGENPVAQIPGYRMTVIKTLPQLQKLDN
jgi:Leucine-rich repeat (LRR) protein